MADCGPQPSDAAYQAAGKTHAEWLQDYYAWVNCVNGAQDPALACPPGYHWEGPADHYGKCVPNPNTIPVAVPPPVITPPVKTPTTPPVTTPPVITPPVTTPPGVTKPAENAGGGPTGGKLHPNTLGFSAGSYCDLYWDDPLCDLWGQGPGGIVIGGGGTTIEQPIIIQEGLAAADVNAIVNGGLDTIWSAAAGAVDIAIAAVVGSVQAALTDLGNAVKAAWTILSRLGGFILNFLHTLLRQIVAGLLRIVQDLRDLIREVYDKVLKPLAHAIGNLRDRLLDLYKRFIRPLLIVIQDIRRVLGILSLFHVKWAAKLDAQLANLERRITQPLFFLLKYSNQVANWLNLIVTARYLFQKPMFLNSLNAYKGSAINLQLNAMIHTPDAAKFNALQQSNLLPSTGQSEAGFTVYVTSGSGSAAALSDEKAAELRRTLGIAA